MSQTIPLAKMSDVGGPAFPTEPNTQPGFYSHHGMSLRDWFAGQAMQAFMSWKLTQPVDDVCHDSQSAARHYAKIGYAIADAMLAERAKATGQS